MNLDEGKIFELIKQFSNIDGFDLSQIYGTIISTLILSLKSHDVNIIQDLFEIIIKGQENDIDLINKSKKSDLDISLFLDRKSDLDYNLLLNEILPKLINIKASKIS